MRKYLYLVRSIINIGKSKLSDLKNDSSSLEKINHINNIKMIQRTNIGALGLLFIHIWAFFVFLLQKHEYIYFAVIKAFFAGLTFFFQKINPLFATIYVIILSNIILFEASINFYDSFIYLFCAPLVFYTFMLLKNSPKLSLVLSIFPSFLLCFHQEIHEFFPPLFQGIADYFKFDSLLLSALLTISLSWLFDRKSHKNDEYLVQILGEIEEKNKSIDIIFAHSHEGIFTINENLEIQSQYSKHLESILEMSQLADKNIVDILVNKSSLSDIDRSLVVSTLSCIGESNFNFAINKSHLPNKISWSNGKDEKFFVLSWEPIVVDGRISKLMISIKDATEIHKPSENK